MYIMAHCTKYSLGFMAIDALPIDLQREIKLKREYMKVHDV